MGKKGRRNVKKKKGKGQKPEIKEKGGEKK